jgi:tungstate transport system substrate-binding protein
MTAPATEIRVAIIGGIVANGFWKAVTSRFVEETGYTITVVSKGPKDIIAPIMRQGQVDLLSMHASDTIINLVADGYACDPQPWLRNDLVIVGPLSDPAGIRGQSDALAALRRVIESRVRFLIHASLGAQEVLRDTLSAGNLQLDPAQVITLLEDKHHQVLNIAAREEAYTLVGRLPFLDGKIVRGDMEIMVRGDSRLRRPYLVVTANPRKFVQANVSGAQLLAAYLRSQQTQNWIAAHGKGRYDDLPLFFAIAPETCCQ